MSRTAAAAAVLALLVAFVAIAVSVVDARRPLDAKVSRSFAVVVSNAGGRKATVAAPACRKTTVAFYDCTAIVTRRGRPAAITVAYHVWVDDDGCWDTRRRTRIAQPAQLGPLRARFMSLRGCFSP